MFAFDSPHPAATPVPAAYAAPQSWEGGTARFSAHWGRSGAVVTVQGEIDAANTEQFADHLARFLTGGDWLVLDLTDVQFIGTAGFFALQEVNAWCTQNRMAWAVVAGAAAARLLRVCDREGQLPMAESTTAALAALPDPRRLLQLVAQPSQ